MAISIWPFDNLARIEQKLDQIIRQNATIITGIEKTGAGAMALRDDVDTLIEEVEENTTVTASVQTLLSNMSEMLTNLKGQIADPAAQKALQDAIVALDRNNKAITAAVLANTPAQDEPQVNPLK